MTEIPIKAAISINVPVSDEVRAVVEMWNAAMQRTIEMLSVHGLTGEEANTLFDVTLAAPAAVFGPLAMTGRDRKITAERFKNALKHANDAAQNPEPVQ